MKPRTPIIGLFLAVDSQSILPEIVLADFSNPASIEIYLDITSELILFKKPISRIILIFLYKIVQPIRLISPF